MGYELMMSQPYLLCPRHAACIVDHVCLTGATKQSNASRSGTGRADQSDSRGGLPAAAGPLSAARAAGEEQGSDGVPLAWPSDRVPAIISAVWRARVRLGLRCAAERYGDNLARLSSLRIITWAMKASILPSSHASERSPVHEGHPR